MSRVGSITLEKLLLEALVPEEEKPYKIPDNWVWVKLKYISKNSRRNIEPSKYSNEIFELYSVPSFPDGNPELVHGGEIGSNKQIVFENDVLICKINPRINRVWIVGEKNEYRQIASTEWIAINKSESVYPRFLMHFFRSPYFRNLLTSNVSGVGGSLTRARPKDVQGYPVALPPLNEQKRIADKVERLLNKINQAKQLIEEVKQTFELRRASILDKAFRGDLTKNWREKLTLDYQTVEDSNTGLPLNHDISAVPDNWSVVTLGDISTLITKGASPKWQGINYTDEDNGILFVTSENVREGDLDLTKSKYVEREFENKQRRSMLLRGDILLNIVGASIGRSAIFNEDAIANINQAVSLIRLKDEQLKDFICFYLNSHIAQNYYSKSKVDVARANLSLKDVANIPIPLPSKEECIEIARIIKKLITIEKSTRKIVESEIYWDNLTNSILYKAFRGELDTNDSSEESAIILLTSILEERK